MTTYDPFDGLHGPRRSAPPGGADRAITAGRRRIVRRRTAGTAAGLSVAMLAGTFAGLRDGDRQGLDPTGQPAGLPIATGTPSLPAVPVSPPATVMPLPTLFPTTTPSPAPEPAEPSAEPTETAAPRFLGVSPRRVQTTMSNDPAACTARPEQSAYAAQAGFCTILTAPTEVRPGQAVTLSFALCRPGGMATRTVTWESDYEVSLDVDGYGPRGEEVERWAWAHAEDFAPHRHTVTFNPGDCRTWRVTWNGQDNDGYALPAGSYQVNGYALAFDWTHEDGDDPMGPPPQYQAVEVKD